MKYPNLNEERKLWRKGYKWVIGIDEAGRGPLAGPVVAAAVVINPKHQAPNSKQIRNSKFEIQKRFSHLNFGHWDLFGIWDLGFGILLKEVKDSKKLTPQKREEFYKILTEHTQIKWGIGRVSEKVIDKINILEATKLAMIKAVKNLSDRTNFRQVDFLILDGNFKIESKIPQKSIVRADEKVFSCVAASIIAKVTRDRIMLKYHKKYPKYRFDRHKGYPTKFHREMLKKYGPCEIHRKSFRPVAKILKICYIKITYGCSKTTSFKIKTGPEKNAYFS